ncbi:18444_t:CDS:1, partial [Racocetra persica]
MTASFVDRHASDDGGLNVPNGNGDERKVLGMLLGAGYNINQIIGA